ncbi:MAG: HlyD family efflux transporter periplasmic adaptor subunit, partial [Planctomycetaceae bacterium]
MPEVDLRELAIDRSGDSDPRPSGRGTGRLLTRYVLPGSVIVGFVLLAGWMAWDLVFPAVDVTVVQLMTSRRAVSESGAAVFQASGWIEPRPTAIRVPALAPGVVESLLVVEDQAVSLGDRIAVLVSDDATLRLASADAGLSLRLAEELDAKAVLQAAETRLARPVHLEAPRAAALGQLARVMTRLKSLPFQKRQAAADLLVAEADHAGKLAARGVVAEIEIARAKAARDRAVASLRDVESRSESLTDELAAWRQQIRALTTRLELLADETEARDQALAKLRASVARVAAAGVMVSEARLRLDRMTITAPAAGRVYQLVAVPGSRVGSGMTRTLDFDSSTVVTMYQPDRLQVRVDVRFDNLPQVSVGQVVRISNAAVSEPLTGRVLLISSIANIQKNTLEIKVAIDRPPSLFKPDMLVVITFLSSGSAGGRQAEAERPRHFLPRALIRSDAAGSYVWLADRSMGRVRRIAVTIGV